MRCGIVSLVGRPNVGKSTLLNNILNIKLAITSDKAGTTRNVIEGIYNDSDSQIVFVDTPGIHKPFNKLGSLLNKKAYNNTKDVDIILFLIDASTGFGKGDSFILERLKERDTNVFLLLNKVDRVKKDTLLKVINDLSKLYDFKEIIPLSALKGDNVTSLIKCLKKYLPDVDPIYEENELTNVSTKFILSEFLREQILHLTKEEIPHSVTCYIENYEEKENIINIDALIVVDRDNLKKIIIGKNGSMLKEISSRARINMEKFLEKKVFLSVYVKTLKNWRDQEKYFVELGLDDE